MAREFEFMVRAVECSKCSKPIYGRLWVERGTLKVKASSGFKVYLDGVICGACDDTKKYGKRVWRSNTLKRTLNGSGVKSA